MVTIRQEDWTLNRMAVCGGSAPPSPPLHPPQSSFSTPANITNEKKKGFHPLRGLRKMFKWRHKASEDKQAQNTIVETRSCSASHLLDDTSSVVASGLSMSHDSVFCPSQHSTTSSISIHQLPVLSTITAELVDVVKRRRGIDSDDEDVGLPASPLTQSPATADCHMELNLKEIIAKSSRSTCSDGSLLSMESSDMYEESESSSKTSLNERKSNFCRESLDELSVTGSFTAPLSHSAAKHKMAVRPKRRYAPARHKSTLGVLPATPEVNEDSLLNINSWSHVSSVPIEIHKKSASLPLSCTSSDAWQIPPQEGFFSRLLARRSSKKKKSVDCKDKLQISKAPKEAPNNPVIKDNKLPSQPKATNQISTSEGTCVWTAEIRDTEKATADLNPEDTINQDLVLAYNLQERNIDKFKDHKSTDTPHSSSTIDGNKTMSTSNTSAFSNQDIVDSKSQHDINSLCGKTEYTCAEFVDLMAKNDISSDEAMAQNTNVISRKENRVDKSVKRPTSLAEPISIEIGSLSLPAHKSMHSFSVADRKLSLTELSCRFEKGTDTALNIKRQKSFSFEKNENVMKEKIQVKKSLDDISKLSPNAVLEVDKINLKNQEKNKGSKDNQGVTFKAVDCAEQTFLINRKYETTSPLVNKQELADSESTVKRRCSKDVLRLKEEEPELLKVFARRSLKTKDIELDAPIKSRDSDKENEDSITENKWTEYQKSSNVEDSVYSLRNACRQRSKTLPELTCQTPFYQIKDNEEGLVKKSLNDDHIPDEPKFIRIQQRKEEWERRAKQAMGQL